MERNWFKELGLEKLAVLITPMAGPNAPIYSPVRGIQPHVGLFARMLKHKAAPGVVGTLLPLGLMAAAYMMSRRPSGPLPDWAKMYGGRETQPQ